MYFSKIISHDKPEIIKPSISTQKTHQEVWNFFPDNEVDQTRDFIFVKYGNLFYVVSERFPKPDQKRYKLFINKNNNVYNPKLKNDMELFFDLRFAGQHMINEKLVCISIAYAKILKEKQIDFNWNHVHFEASKQWMEKHSKNYGFVVIDHNFLAHDYYHFNNSKKKLVTFNSLDLQGTLKITDAEKFIQTLCKGIVKKRAYGCGLLMVKHIPRPIEEL